MKRQTKAYFLFNNLILFKNSPLFSWSEILNQTGVKKFRPLNIPISGIRTAAKRASVMRFAQRAAGRCGAACCGSALKKALAGGALATAAGFLFCTACAIENPPALKALSGETSAEDSSEEKTSERDTPEESFRCRAKTEPVCSGDILCEGDCRKLFSSLQKERRCLEAPRRLVEKFKELLDSVADGENPREINLSVLSCLLDIEETPLVRKLARLNKEKSQEFLAFAAENKKAAEILDAEDKEHSLLKALYNNLSSEPEDLQKLNYPIDGRTHFLELAAAENNPEAWSWMDDFAEKECETSSVCEADQKNRQKSATVFYCRLFANMNKGRLRALMNSALFKAGPGREMESEKVCGSGKNEECDSREIQDYKDFCASYTSRTSL